jgi:hypothetical protein
MPRVKNCHLFVGLIVSASASLFVSAATAAPTTTAAAAAPATAPAPRIELRSKHVTIDLSMAPDLKDWCATTLLPVCDEWYPAIVKMLPSDGYHAPERFSVAFATDMGATPASASGTRIRCNAEWFRKNLKGEAAGAVVHEMVHVVQRYGRARRQSRNAAANPGWIVEGIADYVRWFIFEPQSRGAVVTDPARARYDASYRTTAAFLNWVTQTHDPDIVPRLNAAMREGRYSDDLWREFTGKSADELGEEWKQSLRDAAAAPKDVPSGAPPT